MLGVAAHSETKEHLVIYISLDASLPGPRMRARPLSGKFGFETPVSHKTDKDKTIPRFVYVGYELAPDAAVSG